MSNKTASLKEKLKQALISTERAISEDFDIKGNSDQKQNSKKLNFFDLENLNSKSDFIKARADSDSSALKKKFSNNLIFKKNLPSNSSCKSLYTIAEKIRYETLGGKMLKGIEKNFKENYEQMINLRRKDNLKSKEDVPIVEAFELYMLKKFHNIKLNSLANKMLNFWETDFSKAIDDHVVYLKENLEFQDEYSSKFSEILQNMDVFQSEENEETKEENQENENTDSSNDEKDNDSDNKKDQNKEEETLNGQDSDFDVNEYNLDDQLLDTESDQENNEQIIQKKKIKRSKY